MRRNLAYWKTKLAAAEMETAKLRASLNIPAVAEARTGGAPIAVFICAKRHRDQKRWHAWIAKVRERRRLRARLLMLTRTKLPYYKEQIARRTNRTAFDAIASPLV